MQIWDLNRIDRSSRIFNFSLQSSFVFLKERTTFVVEPERICQNFMGRSHLVFCRLSIEYSACFNRSFTPYQCDQFCLTGNSFRKNRIACPDAVRSVCIASPYSRLFIFFRKLSCTFVRFCRFTCIKSLYKVCLLYTSPSPRD